MIRADVGTLIKASVNLLSAQIAHEDRLVPYRSIPDRRQEMPVLAKTFSAVLLALPISLAAL
jgi:hypothetical protein